MYTPDVDDPYVNAEIAIPRVGCDEPQFPKVTKRLKNSQGLAIGAAHENPILDSRNYVVGFMDGHEEALQKNLIAEYMFSNVNEEGHT